MNHRKRASIQIAVIMGVLTALHACSPAGEPESAEKQGASDAEQEEGASMQPPTFEGDLDFLRQHTEIELLSNASGNALVAIAPAYQARVMTSTSSGLSGRSYGWLNRELISSSERREHINAFGGEDRFWLGPEGGQFSIFFEPGDPFDLEHWQTPEPIDWGAWDLSEKTSSSISYVKEMSLVNYSKTRLSARVNRHLRLIEAAEAGEIIGTIVSDISSLKLDEADFVGFESRNTLENTGAQPWTPASGLLSVWILGMFQPSDGTLVIVPFEGAASNLDDFGPTVNDAYFGKVPAERLHTIDGVHLFSGDGRYRSKIGLSQRRAKPYLGSYSLESSTLTLVTFSMPDEPRPYVNSMWEMQDEPYGGDVVNSYNDGPPSPGVAPLGPFYELETSSPAAALAPGETLTHIHRTFHFQLKPEQADVWLSALFRVSTEQLEQSLP